MPTSLLILLLKYLDTARPYIQNLKISESSSYEWEKKQLPCMEFATSLYTSQPVAVLSEQSLANAITP